MTATTDKRKSVDQLIGFVVKHPIRVDALAILNERVASPKEIAEIIEANVSRVGNHVRALEDYGCVELVYTQPRGGAVEHFYRASLRPNISDEEWAKLPETARGEISTLVFQAIIAEGLGAMRAGKFDARKDRHLSWRVVNVDEEGWKELTKDKAEALDRVEEVEANSTERMLESGEEGLSVIVAAMVFERAKRERSLPASFS